MGRKKCLWHPYTPPSVMPLDPRYFNGFQRLCLWWGLGWNPKRIYKLYLKNLKISDFRSYEFLDLNLEKGTNIIIGKNAQGKTNIIEAVNYFSTLKSHRFVSDKELIRSEKEKSVLKIEYNNEKRDMNAKISLFKSSGRELLLNDIKCDNSSFIGSFNSVIFSPEDLNLIKGDKESRRKFLDMDICQVRPKYYKILKYYNYFLRNRNKLLKEEADNDLMSVYTDKMTEFGVEVLIYRLLFVERLKETTKRIYKEISNNNENLEIKYSSSLLKDNLTDKKIIRENYYNLLEQRKKEEEYLKSTTVGPHRDDLEFFIGGKSVKSFSSQGQMRTIILALKLSELIFIEEITGNYPILLLDDILSELDKERQERLFSYITKCQTILTITDAQAYEDKNAKAFQVSKDSNGVSVIN